VRYCQNDVWGGGGFCKLGPTPTFATTPGSTSLTVNRETLTGMMLTSPSSLYKLPKHVCDLYQSLRTQNCSKDCTIVRTSTHWMGSSYDNMIPFINWGKKKYDGIDVECGALMGDKHMAVS
jgi:hypothetical protein